MNIPGYDFWVTTGGYLPCGVCTRSDGGCFCGPDDDELELDDSVEDPMPAITSHADLDQNALKALDLLYTPRDGDPDMPAPVAEVDAVFRQVCLDHHEATGSGIPGFVYTTPERPYPTYEPNGDWLVGPNYEGFMSTLVWKAADEAWHYRSRSGNDRPLPGGHEEALSHVRCAFG